MDSLLNCPFCGSSASVRIDDEKQDLDVPNLVVACDNPKCQVYQKELHETFEDAIAAWNCRAPLNHAEGDAEKE